MALSLDGANGGQGPDIRLIVPSTVITEIEPQVEGKHPQGEARAGGLCRAA